MRKCSSLCLLLAAKGPQLFHHNPLCIERRKRLQQTWRTTHSMQQIYAFFHALGIRSCKLHDSFVKCTNVVSINSAKPLRAIPAAVKHC